MNKATVLATKHLSAGYGERVVLDALSLDLAARRTTVVLGPGGSGKSTLLHALAGADGVPGFWMSGAVLRDSGLSSSLRQRPSADARSLRERLGVAVGKAAEDVLRTIWPTVTDAAQALAAELGTPVPSLPASLQHLAELTIAIAHPATTLLLDEPDAGLTDLHLDWSVRLLDHLRGTRSVILVTHHLGFARAVADDVVLLVDGSVIESGPVGRFFSQPRHTRTADFLRWGA